MRLKEISPISVYHSWLENCNFFECYLRTGPFATLKHYHDFDRFRSTSGNVNSLKSEMINLFRQKRDLGLIPCLSKSGNKNQINNFADEIELIFLIANHDPASLKLKNELKLLPSNQVFFISSNFLGYGLFENNKRNLSDFQSCFFILQTG